MKAGWQVGVETYTEVYTFEKVGWCLGHVLGERVWKEGRF